MQIKNKVLVIWDENTPEIAIKHSYIETVCESSPSLEDYLGKNPDIEFAGRITDHQDTLNKHLKAIFILVERRTDRGCRFKLNGLSILKSLRLDKIDLPIVLFSFLELSNKTLFVDKDDYINPLFMQFFVRLPGIKTDIPENFAIGSISEETLGLQKKSYFNKKGNTLRILDQLTGNIERVKAEKDTKIAMIRDTFSTIKNWIPDTKKHPYLDELILNKIILSVKRGGNAAEVIRSYKSKITDLVERDIDPGWVAGH